MFDILPDMPALTLLIKFMVASSVLLGSVWLMEKTRILNTPDLADMAWKLAIAGSFIALLPIGDWISRPITIEHEKTAALVREILITQRVLGKSLQQVKRVVDAGKLTAEDDFDSCGQIDVF